MNTPDDSVVISTILRAGLPYHQGFLSYLDNAENAFVSAYRKYKDRLNFDIHIEYIASPRLTDKTLIITDPMLATGSSMELAYERPPGAYPCRFHHCQQAGNRISPA